MKTLIFSSQPSLYLPNSLPWKPKTLTFHPTTLQNLGHLKRSAYKTHANAKGFGSAPPATTKEMPTSKNSGKNDNNDGDEEVPQVVFERMLVRIIAAVGLPLATGFAFLKVFDAVKEKHLWDVPLWLPFLTTLLTFGASALGIAYGALSTSWDAEKKGSVLGLEEAQSNWVEMWREEDESNNSNK
ncbi:hypothetical protein ACFX13_002078 [Malus domestica]|uniref:Uncharacterized protein n=1 Tax=Malus domestica TaxID=3750 RepID=A0A498KTQ1_MALDO|nr:uncharacterized protein PAM68-like [Malus domestica]XP_050140718.1 uncharacterized protein PAM68-like [Malus sylvestris]RXI08353.1 hypothetical protein DVH24_022497 [Malus domestica]